MKIELHPANFVLALAIEPAAARRVAKIIEPVTRHFLISSRFVVLADQPVTQRCNWKRKRSQWGHCIPPQRFKKSTADSKKCCLLSSSRFINMTPQLK